MAKYSLEYIRNKFKEAGYELLADEYKNNKEKLRYRCPKHPETDQFIRYNDLQSGHGCRLCKYDASRERLRRLAEGQRTPVEEVEKEFTARGYIVNRDSYKNARTPIEFTCPKHPDKYLRIKIGDLRAGGGCKYCAIERSRTPIEDIENLMEKKGYTFIGRERIDGVNKVLYKCNKHPENIQNATYYDLKIHGCWFCGVEKISGRRHYKYNKELSEEERSHDRRYDVKEREWRSNVFERDGYKCTVCETGRPLNAHHKDGHNWCVERRYDVDNGVTLCEGCHADFHRKYGYGDNTEEQFEEWKETKSREKVGV